MDIFSTIGNLISVGFNSVSRFLSILSQTPGIVATLLGILPIVFQIFAGAIVLVLIVKLILNILPFVGG